MARDLRTVGPDTDESAALDIMLESGFRHLPVVDGGSVLGMISIRDVAHHTSGQR
jgi:CBS domain-containing protein